MPKIEQSASSSVGRDESQIPSARASGDRMQSTLKEDDDMVKMLLLGVKLMPKLVRFKKIRTLRCDKLPNQYCNVVYLRTRLHLGIPNDPNS